MLTESLKSLDFRFRFNIQFCLSQFLVETDDRTLCY